MAKFNQETMLKDLIETANKADVTLKEAMQKVSDEFGEAAIGKDGLKRNAFRNGAKLETRQKEANRIGLSLEQAESLAYIIAGVNNHRPTLWQTYQIAYFGLHEIKPPKPPAEPREQTEAEIMREDLKEERESMVELAKQYRNSAKIRRAEATIALASGDKDKAGNLKRQAEVFDERAAGEKEKAKEITAQLVELKTGNTKAKLIDKVIALRDEIKAAGVIDGDINAMTIGDLIDYLA
jgi:hypothetical protein